MKKTLIINFMLAANIIFAVSHQVYFDFQTVDAKTLGVDPKILQELADDLFKRNTQVLMVVYKDKVVCERYLPDWNRYKPHGTASAAKGIVGGLSLMLAMHDGLIALDDLASKYIPQWRNDSLKSKITIRQLGSHTSGLDDSTESGYSDNMKIPGWKGDFWRQERSPFEIARDETPVIFPPGTGVQYSNPGIGMLNYAVTVAIKDAEHNDIRSYLWERLLKKMGVPKEEWIVGYGKTFELDGLKLVASWGGGTVSARAIAAVGRLLLNKGSWNGEQLIDAKVVEAALKHPDTNSYCSCGFWINSDITGKPRWPDMPFDAVMASGRGDQVMIFSSVRDYIVVRFGADNIETGNYAENSINTYIGKPLFKAIGDLAPYPKSEK